MRIALGADHAGFSLKQELRQKLSSMGHEVLDFGTASAESTDYPDYAALVGAAVSSGSAERGLLVCSTGVGMSIAANKVPGVRAALGMNADEVHLTRAHNDANILTMGARYMDAAAALELIQVFLETPFEEGRHARRVAKISEMEKAARVPVPEQP
jgi:RpiB/LacA/LacB family sugar-phosphate isomerase